MNIERRKAIENDIAKLLIAGEQFKGGVISRAPYIIKRLLLELEDAEEEIIQLEKKLGIDIQDMERD